MSTVEAAVAEARSYVYDEYERLCKTINPESGSTVIDYDAADNIAWTADGLNLPSTTSCDRDQVTAAQKTVRTYDDMGRVTAVTTPGGTADVATAYFADGKVQSVTAANPGGSVTTTYTYNKRRLLTAETQTNGSVVFTLTYGYTGNGNLSAIGYPDGQQVVTYTPDALGRPTAVAANGTTYASNVAYYPNGAMSAFTYGSGVTHTMTQNARKLPSRSQDIKTSSGLVILDDTYKYDANGNVTDIIDAAQTGSASQTRGMGYDGLDRLTTAIGPWGTGTYTYDALDNLRTADQGTRQYRYNYDATTWRLSTIKNPAGSTIHTFGYDAQGNQTTKNSQGRVFDSANRLNQVTGVQTYRYDGLGRRVQTTDADNKLTYWTYSQAGQVLYTSEGRRNRNLAYIYLNGSQIATRAQAWAPLNTVTVRYQYTDALSSPVADSNASATAASINRTSYTPWGEATPTVDGTGYTGHVMDAGTNLTYMQQRYYDPQIGRFISTDPIASEFNPFSYGRNNPFRFTDPDGRKSVEEKRAMWAERNASGEEVWGAVTTYGGDSGPEYHSRKQKTIDPLLDQPWVETARGELGQAENPSDTESNPRIQGYWQGIPGFGPNTEDSSNAWCAAFANWTLGQNGIPGTASPRARSYAGWGDALTGPAVGAIGVHVKRDGTGHVSFVVGVTRSGSVVALGGNQGDRVKYSTYPAGYFSSFRYPTGWIPNYVVPVMGAPTTTNESTR